MLGSVFTHMQHRDVVRYAKEVARVLKPGGRCMVTYFLWPMGYAVGLRIDRVEHGNWSGREGISYQDMILASKHL